ncbi:MAG: hypothetical protein IPL73_05270 [Candidatus Obscuribacter sp.]|nr:hypothetical protein [Candidatus Obscuribacter sp.]
MNEPPTIKAIILKYLSDISIASHIWKVLQLISEDNIRRRAKFESRIVPDHLYKLKYQTLSPKLESECVICCTQNGVISTSQYLQGFDSRRRALTVGVAECCGITMLIPPLIFTDMLSSFKARIVDLEFDALESILFHDTECFKLTCPDGHTLVCGKNDFVIRYVDWVISTDPPMKLTFELSQVALDAAIKDEEFVL